MNLVNLLTSVTGLFLIAGLLILVINLIFSAIRVSRGHLRAGILNVVLALAACVLIAIGLVRMTFPTLAAAAAPADAAANVGAPGNQPGGGSGGAPQGVSNNGAGNPAGIQPAGQTDGAPGTIPAPLQTAIASGRIPAPVQTQIAEGTIPAQMQTAIASGRFGRSGGGGGQNGQQGAVGTADASAGQGGQPGASGTPGRRAGTGGQNGTPGRRGGQNGQQGAAGTADASAGQGGQQGGTGGQNGQQTGQGGQSGGFAAAAAGIPPTRILTLIVVIAAGIIAMFSFILYRRERERREFEPSSSPGLLYTGAGIFVVVAALVVPGLPAQFATRTRAVGVASVPTSSGPLPTRVMQVTSTPTEAPSATPTSSPMPSLTPLPNASPTPMFTAIALASTDVSTQMAACTLTAQTIINLRGDPSVQTQAVGKVFAGSLLTVTGQTPDKKWWRVISTDGGSPVEGWVSTDFVKTMPSCVDDPVPQVGPTLTPSRTLRPTRTLPPTRTPRASATPPASATATDTATTVATVAPATATDTATSTTAVAVAVTETPTPAASATTVSSAPASNTPTTPADTASPNKAGGNTAATCIVMTTTSVSLRPDPSKQHPPIAQIAQGTALTANGKSLDAAWWRVAYTIGDASLTGWVGGSTVFASSACAALPQVTAVP